MNLLSVIFAQVYFPTFSNGLKEIAASLWVSVVRLDREPGFKPLSGDENGRHQDRTAAKQALITYNVEDCPALEAVAHKLR